MARSRGLNEKHLKALELLKSGNKSVAEIAKEVRINREHLFHLISGAEKAGPVAEEFSKAYKSFMEATDKRIAAKARELREKIIVILDGWVESECKKKRLSKDYRKSLVDTVRALTAGNQTYNIGSVSYSKGMSGEDLVTEFKRLNAAAKASLNRSGIQGSTSGRAGILSAPSGAGNQGEEEE